MGSLSDRTVVLGVSGGIAAYRSCELCRLLIKDGARVAVVMTEAAARLVGPATFQALSGRPVEVGWGGAASAAGMEHIDLGRDADAIVVAPATANTLAKIRLGLADNLLTATALARRCPLLLAPAMNTRMWDNPATRENLAWLRAQPLIRVVGPAEGSLACGEEGAGRMAEPADILEAVRASLRPADLAGARVLVTAGPTREAIDPVRFLSNRSSGKMGYALAAAASRRGAKVTLVSGPTALAAAPGVELVPVTSAAEMARAVRSRFSRCDALLMAAAVADFTVQRPARSKIKKDRIRGPLRLTLVPTEDILASLGRSRRGRRPWLIGFAAETGDPVPAAKDKLARKRLDLVVGNDVSEEGAGFEVDSNHLYLVERDRVTEVGPASKDACAERILDRLAEMLAEKK
jgi:phosphopantothenoylcysteine decarboxylase/phosphopantothenate--cysteine ligase